MRGGGLGRERVGRREGVGVVAGGGAKGRGSKGDREERWG